MDFTRISTYNRETLNNYNPGEMHVKVDIINPNITEADGDINEHGEIIAKPKLFKRVWANVTPLRGSEAFVAGREENKVYYRVKTRYQEGFNPDMHIIWNGVTLYIQSIMNIAGRQRFVEFTAYDKIRGDVVTVVEESA